MCAPVRHEVCLSMPYAKFEERRALSKIKALPRDQIFPQELSLSTAKNGPVSDLCSKTTCVGSREAEILATLQLCTVTAQP